MFQDLKRDRYERGHQVWGWLFFLPLEHAGWRTKPEGRPGAQETGVRPPEVPDQGGLTCPVSSGAFFKGCWKGGLTRPEPFEWTL